MKAADVKKRIEGLIEHDYLKRDAEKHMLYHYVAWIIHLFILFKFFSIEGGVGINCILKLKSIIIDKKKPFGFFKLKYKMSQSY